MYLKNRMGENHGSVDSSVTGLKMVMVGNVVLYTLEIESELQNHEKQT